MQTTIIILLFALGGVLKGIADAVHNPTPLENGLLLRIWRIDFGAIRLGWFIDMPLDAWHISITLHYACFCAANNLTLYWLGAPAIAYWIVNIGWLVTRPAIQNTVQDSLLKNKFVFRFW